MQIQTTDISITTGLTHEDIQLIVNEISAYKEIKKAVIFGSRAKGNYKHGSDVDICIETETPNPFLIMDIKEFLENLFECSVDIVRFRSNMNPFLKQQIENEGIYV